MNAYLQSAIDRLHSATRLDDIANAVRTAARHAASADGAVFVLREGDRCLHAGVHLISECLLGSTMLRAEVAVVPDVDSDARVPRDPYRPASAKSLVTVPVGSPRPAAAIGAYWLYRHVAKDDEIYRLTLLARETGEALAHAGLTTEDVASTPEFGRWMQNERTMRSA